jgi:NAD(P)-dependent dehydrogenase (short-subunit alcohol dehydrogenase family)
MYPESVMKRATRIMLERPAKPARVRGRTFVVTGTTSGLGRGAAQALQRAGGRVVAVVRSETQVRRTWAALSTAGNSQLEVLHADLASRQEVETLAVELTERCPEIHGLLHCAGLRLPARELGPDGIETMFAVEVLSPFLLTLRLLEPLVAGSPSRVVMVAGEEHRRGILRSPRLDPGNLQGESRFSPAAHGRHLTLARILLAQELARRLPSDGISVFAVAPGPTWTGLYRHYPWHLRLLERARLLARRAQPLEAGAQRVVQASVDPELAGSSGGYLVHGREVVPAPPARDLAAARELWERAEELLGERFLPSKAASG